jgi:hypothetical protein
MIVFRLVEWVNSAEVKAYRSNMVGNNIYHHPDSTLVAFLDEVFEVIFGTKVGVHILPIGSPVTVVTSCQILNYRTNPDCVKSKALNVV